MPSTRDEFWIGLRRQGKVKIEGEIIRIILSSDTDSLRPNSGSPSRSTAESDSTTKGDLRLGLGIVPGHVMTYDESNSLSLECIFGFYFREEERQSGILACCNELPAKAYCRVSPRAFTITVVWLQHQSPHGLFCSSYPHCSTNTRGESGLGYVAKEGVKIEDERPSVSFSPVTQIPSDRILGSPSRSHAASDSTTERGSEHWFGSAHGHVMTYDEVTPFPSIYFGIYFERRRGYQGI
ncbi:hypothetical protein CKAN_00407500 [Cinnamomum micranthum f. kanehirae]|uniref:Uncharacterized protein n=1 Tax=Cinnamomum micranthum f. kanehirae TaxID=337451 RepID=A0A3S3ML31_9MAGN|nr:hypothetical protein CKAN_00407500 [Cinnamomum micranthum f. kanehirae]